MFLLLGMSVAAAGCGSGGNDSSGQGARTASIYATVIRKIAAERPRGRGEERTVFVDGVSGYQVPLQAQVKVVSELKNVERVRFIDDLTEAVDVSLAAEPVRGGGLLIVLGRVASAGDRVEVSADRYLRLDDVVRHTFMLEASGKAWRVVGEPETTPTSWAPIRRRGES